MEFVVYECRIKTGTGPASTFPTFDPGPNRAEMGRVTAPEGSSLRRQAPAPSKLKVPKSPEREGEFWMLTAKDAIEDGRFGRMGLGWRSGKAAAATTKP